MDTSHLVKKVSSFKKATNHRDFEIGKDKSIVFSMHEYASYNSAMCQHF